MPRVTPKIPQGLEELMLNLAKSIIKENPDNLYEFAAEYFEKLLKERDGKVDQSYKNLPVYKAYKRAKLEKNRLEVEGIKIELEARKRISSAQTSRSFNRSSSATKNVEKLPKIASSSAEVAAETSVAENSRKSAKKLPNISGTGVKVAAGAVAVGVAAGAVKPALMAVKPQMKSEEVVEFETEEENSANAEDSSAQSASNGEQNSAEIEGAMEDSGVDLRTFGDVQVENTQNVYNEVEDLTQNDLNEGLNRLGTENILVGSEIDSESTLDTQVERENNSEDASHNFEISEINRLDTNPSDDFIECSTVDVNFLNRESTSNDDNMTENSNEIVENVIDSNEHKVDGIVDNQINEIVGNEYNDDEGISMTDKNDGNKETLTPQNDEIIEESKHEGQVPKLTKYSSINSATSAEGDYNSSNPSIKSSEFSNLSGDSLRYEILNVSSDTQSFDDNLAGNVEDKAENLKEIGENSKLISLKDGIIKDSKLIEPNDYNLEIINSKDTSDVLESKFEEPNEFGNELVDKIKYFEENKEILEDSEEVVEDMETKFEKFGKIMKKIEESDVKVEENIEKINGIVENLSENSIKVDEILHNSEGKFEENVVQNDKNSDIIEENSETLNDQAEIIEQGVKNINLNDEGTKKINENEENFDSTTKIDELDEKCDEDKIESSEYDLNDFIAENSDEISESPTKKLSEISKHIEEDSKIFENEVINVESILDDTKGSSLNFDGLKPINEEQFEKIEGNMKNINENCEVEDSNAETLNSEDRVTKNKSSEILKEEIMENIQDSKTSHQNSNDRYHTLNEGTANDMKTETMTNSEDIETNPQKSPNSQIHNIKKRSISDDLTDNPSKYADTNPTFHSNNLPLSPPDYYQEVDSKATTAEMKDDEFIFKSPQVTDIAQLTEQKFTVDDNSTQKSVQGNESEISVQNDIELSQQNANEAATGSDNVDANKFANENEIGGNQVENLIADKEKDIAAVKIQSLFRGYQVRKSQKFEDKLDEIVNNKFESKSKEPCEFGSELVEKIRDFEENIEETVEDEEVVEDMETKFEKFGEIMRKIEESDERTDEHFDSFGEKFKTEEENSDKNPKNSTETPQNQAEAASNLKDDVTLIQDLIKDSTSSFETITDSPILENKLKQKPEESSTTVDGNITENSKDEDFIDILLDESTTEDSVNQEFVGNSSRNKRSISPETGELIEVETKIDTEDPWTEDFDALKMTKSEQKRQHSALRAGNQEEMDDSPKNIDLNNLTSEGPQKIDKFEDPPSENSDVPYIQDGIDEVDLKISSTVGLDNKSLVFNPTDSNTADTSNPSNFDITEVKNKNIHEQVTKLDNFEQIEYKNDDDNNELIEIQTKTEENFGTNKAEDNEDMKINEIVASNEEFNENVNKDSESEGKNPQKYENDQSDVDARVSNNEEKNERNFGKIDDEVKGEATSLSNTAKRDDFVEHIASVNDNKSSQKTDNSSPTQPGSSSSSDSSNDLTGFNYEVLPSPPVDSPRNSDDDENFDEIVRNLSPNSNDIEQIEKNFCDIAEDVQNLDANLDKNVEKFIEKVDKIDYNPQNIPKNYENDNILDNIIEIPQENTSNMINTHENSDIVDSNSENLSQTLEDPTNIPENPIKTAQIFEKYLNIYDENLDNFEFFTNNPDGTLKKSPKIVEKLNEIVEDEVAKYVEKMELEGLRTKLDNDNLDTVNAIIEGENRNEVSSNAQFDVFEYAVPINEPDFEEKHKLNDLPLVFKKNEDLEPEVDVENLKSPENITPEPEIIEEPIVKQDIKPQLSESVPILRPNNPKLMTNNSKNFDEKESAAVKIQSFFRGFKVRKSHNPKIREPSDFGNELVDKIEEFEAKNENSDKYVEDMEAEFEKFGEIMKKIEESEENVKEDANIQDRNSSNLNSVEESKSENLNKSDSKLDMNLKVPNLNNPQDNKSSDIRESKASIPSKLNNPSDDIPTNKILNPLQGFEKFSQKFEQKLEENSAEQAAVKIQSLFRGFKVRKTQPPRKYKQNVKEPSAFGSELVDKIEEFEEKEVKSENIEDVVEDMETKFEKFGEIMRKIEESEETAGDHNGNLSKTDEISHKTSENETEFSKIELGEVNSTSLLPTSQSTEHPSNDTEQANAAVKIQSFFRGFKVRKSNPIKKHKATEPSEFGNELVEKIQDFEENQENLEITDENPVDMEEKFEKFGEIMKKIEESEEKFEDKIEGLDVDVNFEEDKSDGKKKNNEENLVNVNENDEIMTVNVNKEEEIEEKNSKTNENLDKVPNVEQYSKDVKSISSASKNHSKQATDDETNAAVKIQSFFRGFKVRKDGKSKKKSASKSKELSQFGNELVDKIEEFEAKNGNPDEFVEDMEAEFDNFGKIMKKIEESEENVENNSENLEKTESKSEIKFESFQNTDQKLERIEEKSNENSEKTNCESSNQDSNNVNPEDNSQNILKPSTTPPPTPEDPPKTYHQNTENVENSGENEEVDQLSIIYEQNSVEEEACIEKIISYCGPNLEQNVNELDEKIICEKIENSIEFGLKFDENSDKQGENDGNLKSENEKLTGKISKKVTNPSIIKYKDQIKADEHEMLKNVDIKSQKFVKVGDKFVRVEDNQETFDDMPKTDNEVLENLAKSTEKLSKFSEKLSKSPARNSSFDETSEKFEEISKQFDKISMEYDKLYKKIEEKFEENLQILEENHGGLGKIEKVENKISDANFDEKLENSSNFDTKNELGLKTEENCNQINQNVPSKTSHTDNKISSDETQAAVKIQSTFRGYKVRKSRYQKFKDNLSEKFNLNSEPKIEEPSVFGTELIEKIKDFDEKVENNLKDSEEVIEDMESKFEKFGEIMRKIEESDGKVAKGGDQQEEKLEKNEDYTDDFDMDSLEYDANGQKFNDQEMIKNAPILLKNSQNLENNDETTINLTEISAINDKILQVKSDKSQENPTQKPSKIPIKEKSQPKLLIKSESFQDSSHQFPSDSKSINKLSHSTDHTPLLSPINSDPNLQRRQSYIDSVIHQIEGSHVIEGGLIGYGDQFSDLKDGNMNGFKVGGDFDETEMGNENLSENKKENFDKIEENSDNLNLKKDVRNSEESEFNQTNFDDFEDNFGNSNKNLKKSDQNVGSFDESHEKHLKNQEISKIIHEKSEKIQENSEKIQENSEKVNEKSEKMEENLDENQKNFEENFKKSTKTNENPPQIPQIPQIPSLTPKKSSIFSANPSTSHQKLIPIAKVQPENIKALTSKQQQVQHPEAIQPKQIPTQSQSKQAKNSMMRQKTMPVQIESSVMRVLPKHLRKRIQSAEGEKKKKRQIFNN